MSLVVILFVVLLLSWANRMNECEDCGSQLRWCDPERADVPLTRCFICEGSHPAYTPPGGPTE